MCDKQRNFPGYAMKLWHELKYKFLKSWYLSIALVKRTSYAFDASKKTAQFFNVGLFK